MDKKKVNENLEVVIMLIVVCVIVVFFMTLTSAVCTGTNEFATTTENVTVCGYCYSNFSHSPCNSTQVCNLDIFYTNGTYVVNQSQMNNTGDGSFNLSVNLTSGSYKGVMYCSGKSRKFTITVGASTSGSTTGGSGGTTTQQIINTTTIIPLNVTNDRLVKDINGFFDKAGSTIFPSNKTAGILIIIIILLILFTSQEITELVRKLEVKTKRK
jgi:hypothetical protein